jgi:phosphatidate cytidylyltransferase
LAPALADPAVMPARRWGDLRLRVLSAAVLVPIALICVWVGRVPFLILLAIGTAGLVWEWLQLWRGARSAAPPFAIGKPTGRRQHSEGNFRPAPPPTPPQQGAEVQRTLAVAEPSIVALLSGLVVILLAAFCIAWLRADPRVGRYNLLFLLILVWCSDSGAYLTGRIVRGPKLAPRISPGKTVAGAAGGLAAAVFGGICVALTVPHPTSFPLWGAAIVAAFLGVAAQAGDLLESYVKRRFGTKDSGRLIPGHGGLLDRLDALIAATLAAAVLALAQGPGVVLWG